jgi:hypothetical protein
MIFKKKRVPDVPTGLKEMPETTEYKKNAKAFDLNDSEEVPEFQHEREPLDFPPSQNVLEEPPKEEKIFKKSKEKEIFVKIDNFREIVQAIENMEKRLNDLESLLEKLRKLNDQEVSEINSWKSDLDIVREEIKNIGDNLAQ